MNLHDRDIKKAVNEEIAQAVGLPDEKVLELKKKNCGECITRF